MEISPAATAPNRQKIHDAFPATLAPDVDVVAHLLSAQHFDTLHGQAQQVLLRGELLTIPRRLYFDPPGPAATSRLSPIQQTILSCLLLRHHDGFIRQKSLRQLTGNPHYCTIPFIFQLLGEYVIEILFIVDTCINDHTIAGYLSFIADNDKYWQQTQARVISYWDEYYRSRPQYKHRHSYIGQQIVDRLKKAQLHHK